MLKNSSHSGQSLLPSCLLHPRWHRWHIFRSESQSLHFRKSCLLALDRCYCLTVLVYTTASGYSRRYLQSNDTYPTRLWRRRVRQDNHNCPELFGELLVSGYESWAKDLGRSLVLYCSSYTPEMRRRQNVRCKREGYEQSIQKKNLWNRNVPLRLYNG
jgi:hypothetical protein